MCFSWSILYDISLYFSIHTTKIPKIFILLSLSDLTFASYREGIDNPFIALVVRFLFVCVGVWDFWGASYWIDTLVLKNWGKYLRYFAASPFPFQGKTNACSRGSKKDFWRRCRGGLRSSQDIPSTHHKLISLALHYFPFASRFPLPHFTLVVLFALSFPISSLFFACLFLFACVLDYLLPWRKIIPNCVIFPIPIIMISLVLRLLLLMMLSLVKSMLLCWILLWKINSPAFVVKMPLPI